MLDVCLLGTGGTVPLPERWLTSLIIRLKGKEILIDCGEGTQIALHKQRLSCKHIDTILFTHYHADHTAGLPGLLLTMAKSERTEPITIVGPKGLQEILQGVAIVARYIPFEVKCIELTEPECIFEIDDLKVTSFGLRHSVPCCGYSFELQRKPKFNVEKARELNIPIQAWSSLQKGEEVTIDGITYQPSLVQGEQRKGIKLVYATDTRPTKSLQEHAQDADLLITEGMYGDTEKLDKAKLNKHMLMQEAATIAKEANVKELWFTHYSPSMPNPFEYEEELKQIFPNTVISVDGQRKDISFVDE